MGSDLHYNPPSEHGPRRLSSTAWAVIEKSISDVGTDLLKRADFDLPECKISVYRLEVGRVRCDITWHDDSNTVRGH